MPRWQPHARRRASLPHRVRPPWRRRLPSTAQILKGRDGAGRASVPIRPAHARVVRAPPTSRLSARPPRAAPDAPARARRAWRRSCAASGGADVGNPSARRHRAHAPRARFRAYTASPRRRAPFHAQRFRRALAAAARHRAAGHARRRRTSAVSHFPFGATRRPKARRRARARVRSRSEGRRRRSSARPENRRTNLAASLIVCGELDVTTTWRRRTRPRRAAALLGVRRRTHSGLAPPTVPRTAETRCARRWRARADSLRARCARGAPNCARGGRRAAVRPRLGRRVPTRASRARGDCDAARAIAGLAFARRRRAPPRPRHASCRGIRGPSPSLARARARRRRPIAPARFGALAPSPPASVDAVPPGP